MGKRPVNSTKGGKFMNPTDQARKVARKKELKRNKKLRQAVRAAAIKGTSFMGVMNDGGWLIARGKGLCSWKFVQALFGGFPRGINWRNQW